MKIRKKKSNQKQSNQNGITLIALVITIVVMLILAGVTINLTLGENGIFTTAQQAAKNYTEAQNKEQEKLAYFTNTVNNIIEGKTLTSQITAADYGKYINYSVTVEDTVLDKWRVFYNDKTTGNVYIILDGYLPNTLIPEEIEMTITGKYQAYWDTTNFLTYEEAVAKLKNTTYWNAFAGGVAGATATGGPTNEMFVKSWNSNSAVNVTTLTVGKTENDLKDSTKLYIPYAEGKENCYGYWLADHASSMWIMHCIGNLHNNLFNNSDYGVRPLVCLPSTITGTVGTSVDMDK